MVYGWNEYLKEKPHKNPGLSKYLILAMVLVTLFFIYLIVALLIHPWIEVTVKASGSPDIPSDSPSVYFAFTNIGLMKDRNLEMLLTTHSSCGKNFPPGCELKNNIVKCPELLPGESVTFSCEAGPDAGTYSVNVRTTYQAIISEYSCSQDGCTERQSLSGGSTPSLLNYLVLYPFDLISHLSGQ